MSKSIKKLLIILVVFATSCTKICDECSDNNALREKYNISTIDYPYKVAIYDNGKVIDKKFYNRKALCKYLNGCD